VNNLEDDLITFEDIFGWISISWIA